jgi:alginate O-acetyltransferase complex protein AlgI
MLFNSFQFAILFAVVVALHRSLPRAWRPALLLAASLLFYTAWIPAYTLLLLACITVNYVFLRQILRGHRPRVFLALAIVYTLGLLAFFKYSAMAVRTVAPVLESSFGYHAQIPEILLPLGISFYSFQILSVAIDAYRGIRPMDLSFARYALFVSFFPQLIAGPILRGSQLFPQLVSGGTPSRELTQRGIWLITSGLFKKVVMADFLLAPFVDTIFGADGVGGATLHWIALYSFAFQIYFDFSGYTDMARGIGCLLGFELPLNFTEPYLARNPAEFWRCWHITLSVWLRDYLYIPLGGNRFGRLVTYRNLLLTMMLGGLWHGASWNFVIWGGLHGLLLASHRLFARGGVAVDAPLRLRDTARMILFFHATCLLWVFFRAATLPDALTYLESLVSWGEIPDWPVLQTAVVAMCVALHLAERAIRSNLAPIQAATRSPRGCLVELAAAGLVAGVSIAVSGVGNEFIYFQF